MLNIDGWKYYNHAAIPACAPHEIPDLAPIKDGTIWEGGGTPLLARWTEEWDCGYETNWWYVIKDTPFDIKELNSKRRYEINKGLRAFDVREFRLDEHVESVAFIYQEAMESYKTGQKFNRNSFINNFKPQSANVKYFGAFDKNSQSMCAFCYLSFDGKYANYVSHKAIPQYEKMAVNAALIAGMLDNNSEFLNSGGYICDGARSINHETNFQEYLEKYFGFRKAYCKLRIEFRPGCKPVVKMLYPFRRMLMLGNNFKVLHQINSILKMEEIVRKEE